jgi:predicted transcriptional regulator
MILIIYFGYVVSVYLIIYSIICFFEIYQKYFQYLHHTKYMSQLLGKQIIKMRYKDLVLQTNNKYNLTTDALIILDKDLILLNMYDYSLYLSRR